MANISSNKVKVFPSAKRGITYYESRLTAEASFVSIVNNHTYVGRDEKTKITPRKFLEVNELSTVPL